MITLNTESLTIQIKNNFFQNSSPVVLRDLDKKLGSITVKFTQQDTAAVELLGDLTISQQEEVLLGLSQYLLMTQKIAAILPQNLDRLTDYLDHDNKITLASIHQYSKSLPLVSCAIVVLQNHQGHILLGKRPQGKFMPDIWEFPGGKLEPLEDEESAAKRELLEELGIKIQNYKQLCQIQFVFKNFLLQGHVSVVNQWDGDPKPLVHSTLKWVPKGMLLQVPMPLSNLLFLDQIH